MRLSYFSSSFSSSSSFSVIFSLCFDYEDENEDEDEDEKDITKPMTTLFLDETNAGFSSPDSLNRETYIKKRGALHPPMG
jgi:hypothetical protein